MHVRATAGEPHVDKGRRRAKRSLFFGLLSPVLVTLGFGWIPFGIELGLLAGAVALVEGFHAFAAPRESRLTFMAVSGIVLGVLVVAVVLYFAISFAINPPE